MSCNCDKTSEKPKCCEPPKKDASAVPPPTCANLPTTLTFACPADECQPKAKDFCAEKKKDDCVQVGAPPPKAADKGNC